MHTANPIIMIPARMASTRLPNKPLADIAGLPMIVHVLHRAMEADIGPVVVACDSEDIKNAVDAAGGTAIVTDPALPSGSDRIWAALQAYDPDGTHDVVLNLQGDLPTLAPALLHQLAEILRASGADIATLAAEITEHNEHTNPHVVKAIFAHAETGQGRALYFTRATAPHHDGPRYHHIGLYGYRRAALEQFVGLPPSTLETREKLEQLRALEAGMHIEVGLADTTPLGVDTPEDLAHARRVLT
jgi:3-deoxy-manno-octulosonate cytidylyltransferase (CMP-KDO synthetase)